MSLPFLTAELGAIAGQVRVTDDDFVVEERLLYEACGTGTHTYLRIEKRGLSTFEAVRRLARALRRREQDFGYAGLKDRHARTIQTLSLEFADEGELATLHVPGITVLEAKRHKNKLKLGHLRGNAFQIRVRDVGPGDTERAIAVLAELARRGVPNFFGAQRFGRDGVTAELGRRLLAGDAAGFLRLWALGAAADDREWTPAAMLAELPRPDPMLGRALRAWAERGKPERGLRAVPGRFLSLCTSALQSEVFNRVLAQRLHALDRVLAGDVAYLHRNGACFVVEDVEAEVARAAAFEISPSGPMPGPQCLRPTGHIAALEAEVMQVLGVDHDRFGGRDPWSHKGGRRPLRVPLRSPSVTVEPATTSAGPGPLVVAFELPAGSFATAVLAELFKQRSLAPDGEAPDGDAALSTGR